MLRCNQLMLNGERCERPHRHEGECMSAERMKEAATLASRGVLRGDDEAWRQMWRTKA